MQRTMVLVGLVLGIAACEDSAPSSAPDMTPAPDMTMPDLSTVDLVGPDLVRPDFAVPPDLSMPDLSMPDFVVLDFTLPDLVVLDLYVPTCTDNAKNGLETDVDCGGPNCPKCGYAKACAAVNDCASGVCTGGKCGCAAGLADCDNNAGNGCEVTLATNAAHCGGCNMACASGLVCAAAKCQRPAASCAAASPQTVQAQAGYSIAGIALDNNCNVYVSTVLGGIDQLRRVSPAGQLTAWNNPNDNTDGHYVGVSPAGDYLWSTYQEVQWGLAMVMNNTLTLKATGASTTATGPWATSYLNHGPAGVAVDADGTAYVGNLTANGQVHRVKPDGTQALLPVTCAPRVVGLARGRGSDLWMICARQIVRADLSNNQTSIFLNTFMSDARAIAFDAVTADLYVETADDTIWRVPTAGGTPMATSFAKVMGEGLIASGPDNALWRVRYVLNATSGVERYPLPDAP